MSWQLNTYRINERPSTESGGSAAMPCPPPPPTNVRPSAHNTLGSAALNRHHDRRSAHHSLALELDTYLSDLQEGTDPLIYWQVCQANSLHSICTYYFIGELASLPHSFPSCYGHPTHSSLLCSMWTSFLISQRDHDSTSQSHQHKNDGSITDS